LGECIEETLVAKRQAQRRASYLGSLEQYLRAFASGRERKRIDEMTVADIERWFASRHEAPVTRASNLGRLSAMFDLAWRRGYIIENPCRRVERVHVEAKPPVILTIRQAAKVLIHIKRRQPRGLAWFALALMAGVRPEECDRLSWGDVDLDRGIVTVDAAASKVRQRRIVHLQPAAVAWLRLAGGLGAELPLPHVTRRRYLRDLRDRLGWKAWPQDILRHTCASYLMALWQDAGRVAAELGSSPGILLRHYRELVRREDAERFWRLIPRPRKPTGGS
jgi:integrase